MKKLLFFSLLALLPLGASAQWAEIQHDEQKEKQICSSCGGKMQRLLEWEGIATGSGEGWHGRSDGSNAI